MLNIISVLLILLGQYGKPFAIVMVTNDCQDIRIGSAYYAGQHIDALVAVDGSVYTKVYSLRIDKGTLQVSMLGFKVKQSIKVTVKTSDGHQFTSSCHIHKVK